MVHYLKISHELTMVFSMYKLKLHSFRLLRSNFNFSCQVDL